jgi:hypothetical protein
MKRTSIFLDEQTLAQLQRAALRSGVSAASLVREAVALYLATPAAPQSMPSVAGQFSSEMSDTSARVDDLLWRDPHQ